METLTLDKEYLYVTCRNSQFYDKYYSGGYIEHNSEIIWRWTYYVASLKNIGSFNRDDIDELYILCRKCNKNYINLKEIELLARTYVADFLAFIPSVNHICKDCISQTIDYDIKRGTWNLPTYIRI